MPETIYDIVSRHRQGKFATTNGTRLHDKLRHVIIDNNVTGGDDALIKSILACPGAPAYFCATARTEVPIAGTINGNFISRRIDRMVIDDASKTICILDYKTDVDKFARRPHYIHQLQEYCELLQMAHPGYRIGAAILWTHDWTIEHIQKP